MKKKILIWLYICFIFLTVTGAGYILYTDRKQNEQIEKLSFGLEKLLAQSDEEYLSFSNNCGEGFDYLAIGNSITRHPKCDYWWSEAGMAATQKSKDYFHLTVAYLEKQYKSVNACALNFSNWEIQSTDRSETYTLIESALNEDVDLITIQLGENITDTETLEKDCSELIKYIKNNAPNARIVMVGSFWENNTVENIKRKTASGTDIAYADISMLWNKEEYQCGIGTTVYDENGGKHAVAHKGVSIHPNDRGMQCIADAIVNAIQ